MRPVVSVVVVTYNGAPFVRRLLDSLRAQTYSPFEVVVVDNASKDNTADIVEADYPEARLLRQSENHHFAAGNNIGYREAKGEIVVLLNQDTWVEHDWLANLLRPLEEDKEGAIVCTHCPILNEGEDYARSRARFDPAHARLATLSVAGRNCATELPFDPSLVFYGSGAALAVRRSAAGNALFDDDYRAYAEDVALGWRLRVQGGRIVLVPSAHVHHALPPHGRPSSPDMLYMWERNRLFTLYINFTTRTRWLLHPVWAADLLALALPKPAALGPDGTARPKGAPAASPSRRELRRAVGRAILEAMAANPVLRTKHKDLEAHRRVPESQVTAAMTSRITPFDEGLLGRINRFSAAWCRAFDIATVESAPRKET